MLSKQDELIKKYVKPNYNDNVSSIGLNFAIGFRLKTKKNIKK